MHTHLGQRKLLVDLLHLGPILIPVGQTPLYQGPIPVLDLDPEPDHGAIIPVPVPDPHTMDYQSIQHTGLPLGSTEVTDDTGNMIKTTKRVEREIEPVATLTVNELVMKAEIRKKKGLKGQVNDIAVGLDPLNERNTRRICC